MTFRTVTYVVTHESTQNEIYLHNYKITCNLFFYCRISLTVFSTYEFCSKFYTTKYQIPNTKYQIPNTTKDIANLNSVSYMKMYY